MTTTGSDAEPTRRGGTWWNDTLELLTHGPTTADLAAAAIRVEAVRAARPGASVDELVRGVVARAAVRSAAVGAATAGAALVPGIGTVAALSVGTAADVGATLRLQAQMVLDLAVLRGARLTPEEARRAVLLVAGVSGASTAALNRAGRLAAARLGERVGRRWLLRAVPVVGMLASSGTNALATHVIGRRADAYFSLGAEAMGDWRESLRAVTGIEARPSRWSRRPRWGRGRDTQDR